MIVNGLLAGWVAEKITETRHGLLTNLVVRVIGAFVGGKLADLLDIPVFGFFRTLVAAIVGAVLVLWVWPQVRGCGTTPPRRADRPFCDDGGGPAVLAAGGESH